MKLEDLSPHPNNPRQISDPKLKMLKKSLKEFGDLSGIVFNKTTNRLVGGHQRLKVLPKDATITINEQGYGHVSIESNLFTYREVEWDELKEKAANIAANQHGGEWELPKLNDWLLDLDAANYDMDLVGFSKEELENLMAPISKEEPGCDEDEVPEAPKEPITKPGDLYILGAHRLLCGDSTNIQHVERLMGGEKADMVFTDPPYGMNLDTDYSSMKNSEGRHSKKKLNAPSTTYRAVQGDDTNFDPAMIFVIFNEVKEIFLFGADYYADKILNRNDGAWIVWDKRTPSNGDPTQMDKWMGSQFELCWSKQKHKREISRILHCGLYSVENDKRQHPTQKPVALPMWFFERHGVEAKLVVDLYGGSGSTLIACEKTNRKCFMMELDPHYCDVIVARWEKYAGKKAILDGQTT